MSEIKRNVITHKLSKEEKKKVKNYLKGKDELPGDGHSHIFTFPDSYYKEFFYEENITCVTGN